MSRSVGDVLAKRAGVVAEPEVTQFTFDAEQAKHVIPRYLVLASDGVWDVMSNEQVANFVFDSKNQRKGV